MAETPVNRFGRRPGRGIRPWMLLPKVIFVGLFIGSLGAIILIWFTSGFSGFGAGDLRRRLFLNIIGLLVRFLMVPALLCALLFGVILLLQHPRQFIRMRWLVVKLATLAILISTAHLFLYTRMQLLREALEHHTANPAAEAQFGWGFVAVFAVSIWVIILGRLKPRLGQNWARTYAQIQSPLNDPDRP